MHILYVTQHFPPELGAASTRAYEIGRQWVNSGHSVTVLTALPNYPFGKIYPGYDSSKSVVENIDGMEVHRCRINPNPIRSKLSRIKNYTSFFCNALGQTKNIGSFDLVFSTVGPLPVAAIAFRISRHRRVPFVLEYRDITTKQIRATGYAGNFLTSLVKKYELFFAKKADLLVTVSNGYKEAFVQNGIDESKITVIKNGFDFTRTDNATTSPVSTNIIDILQETRKKFPVICGYFGTLGISQDMLSLVKSIAFSKSIFMVIIGQGAQYELIKSFLTSNNVDNVLLHEGIPEQDLVPVYGYIDFSLSVLRNSEYFRPTIPSKIFRSMGYRAIPLFMGPDGEAAAIVKEINKNLYLTSGTQMQRLVGMDKESLKDKAYDICKKKYNRAQQAGELLKSLQKIRTHKQGI